MTYRMRVWHGRAWHKTRQSLIGREIADNCQPYWDWVPFMGYRFDLRKTLARANIAVLPAVETGRPLSLAVGPAHGCLMVDWAKSDQQNADEAWVLLDAFNARSERAADFYGTYTMKTEGGGVAFTPAVPGAALSCSLG